MYGTSTEDLLNSKYMENQIYEHITVMLEKTSHDESYGIAISGGKDQNYNDDPSIVVSDVLPDSPADNLIKINDIIIAINGENVENVDHEYAVQLLRSMKKCVYLLIKRKRLNTHREHRTRKSMSVAPTFDYKSKDSLNNDSQVDLKTNNIMINNYDLKNCPYSEFNLNIPRGDKGFGLYLGNLIFVKDKIFNTPADSSNIKVGDIVLSINDVPVDSCKSTDEILGMIKKSQNLRLKIVRPETNWVPKPLLNKSQHITRIDKNIEIYDGVPSDSGVRIPHSRNDKGKAFNSMRDLRSFSEDVSKPFPRTMSYSRNQKNVQNLQISSDQYTEKRVENFETKQIYETDITNKMAQIAVSRDSRCVKLNNRGSQLGIQLIGGNKYGIFISSMMENSPAAMSGLKVGDQIISVNGVEFTEITREDAVMFLLSLKNDTINLVCVNRMPTFEKIKFQQCDEFYIRVNFDYLKPTNPRELILRCGELLVVRDTMYGGVVGSWSAVKINVNNEFGESGIIPNKTRAEQTAIKCKLEEKKNSEMKRRLRPTKISSTRTKAEYQSQDKLDTISFNEEMIHIPAYQIVVKKAANFKRPIVLIGVSSDVYRDFLKMRQPYEFDIPMCGDLNYSDSFDRKKPAIKLHQIRKIINDGKHCLLDVSYQAVEMLHQANLSPIVINLKMADKKLSNQFRSAAVNMVYGENRDNKSKKEIRDINRYALKFQKRYPIYITSTLEIFDQPVDQVYIELLNIIRSRQNDEIFISTEQIDPNIMESYAMNEPCYRSGYSSAADSGTDDDTESYFSRKTNDDKVFKSNNKFESQQIELAQNNKGREINQKKDRGRNINIEYEDNHRSQNDNSTKYPREQDKFENQRLSARMTNQKSTSTSTEMVELSLNTILKIPVEAKGGLTESSKTNVSIYVPPGALQSKKHNEIFVKIYLPKNSSGSKILNSNENEIVLVCGPEGFVFSRPIEIRMPYFEKSTETIDSQIFITPEISSKSSKWKHFSLNQPGANGNTFNLPNNMVAILVDRF